MIELVYVSRASKRFSDNELITMLTKFRENNTRNDITGMLLYDGKGTFLQAIEGKQDTVTNVFERIKSDTRHSSVHQLYQQVIQQRSFASWQMGFNVVDPSSISQTKGYSNFLVANIATLPHVEQASAAKNSLEYFRSKCINQFS